jgi:hypothetical protein
MIKVKDNWDSITWREYEQLEQMLFADIPETYKTVNIIALLSGCSNDYLESLPIAEFQQLIPSLNFLNTEPETRYHKENYTVNGREYKFKGKLDEITTAQYIDYRAYMNEENKDVVKLLSAFLIPVGHDYNDGYDMEQVQSDIADMCWLDVRAAAFFFRIQLAAYILTLKSSLRKTMKTAKAKKAEIKQVEESLNSMAYYLLYAESVNSQLLGSIQ